MKRKVLIVIIILLLPIGIPIALIGVLANFIYSFFAVGWHMKIK